MSFRGCLIVGILLTLAAAPTSAQDPDEPRPGTFVRKDNFEILPCVERDRDDIVIERRECREGWFTFDRPSLNTILTITKSEDDCRRGEINRLDEPPGWDPLTVVLVTGGTVIVIGGVAFLVGYLVGAS